VVLLAHQGSDIEYQNYWSTEPHAEVLRRLLGREVKWIDDVCGPAAREAIQSLGEGEILLLDNVRFLAEEQTLFEKSLKLTHEQQARTLLVRKLAPLADLYVCDAFAAAHRDQPSLCGFEQVLPSAMGRLFEEEYCVISGLMEQPERPCVFVLGGAKVSDAFLMMSSVLEKGAADTHPHRRTGGQHPPGRQRGGHRSGQPGLYREVRLQRPHRHGPGPAGPVWGEDLPARDGAWVENGRRAEAPLGSIPPEGVPDGHRRRHGEAVPGDHPRRQDRVCQRPHGGL